MSIPPKSYAFGQPAHRRQTVDAAASPSSATNRSRTWSSQRSRSFELAGAGPPAAPESTTVPCSSHWTRPARAGSAASARQTRSRPQVSSSRGSGLGRRGVKKLSAIETQTNARTLQGRHPETANGGEFVAEFRSPRAQPPALDSRWKILAMIRHSPFTFSSDM